MLIVFKMFDTVMSHRQPIHTVSAKYPNHIRVIEIDSESRKTRLACLSKYEHIDVLVINNNTAEVLEYSIYQVEYKSYIKNGTSYLEAQPQHKQVVVLREVSEEEYKKEEYKIYRMYTSNIVYVNRSSNLELRCGCFSDLVKYGCLVILNLINNKEDRHLLFLDTLKSKYSTSIYIEELPIDLDLDSK